MNGNAGTLGIPGEAQSKPGPVKRTIAKLRHKTSHHGGGDDSSSDERTGIDEHNNTHSRTEDYASSIAFALVRELLQYPNTTEGQQALQAIFTTQAKIAASLAVSEGAKEASRIAAQQAVKGSYDAAETKYMEMYAKLPRIVKNTALPIVVCYVAVLAMALLFSLWRFALFGLN